MLYKLLTLILAAISTEAIKIDAKLEASYVNEELMNAIGKTCSSEHDCPDPFSCYKGKCDDSYCMWVDCSLTYGYRYAQVDHPIAGGEGTGTPQEELTELSIELPLFDNELAQANQIDLACLRGISCR